MAVSTAGGTTGKVRRLGRGLSGLLGTPVAIAPPAPGGGGVTALERPAAEPPGGVPPVTPRAPVEVNGAQAPHDRGLEMIEVGAIAPSPFQPRRSFDEAAIAGLAESIKRSGLMQPVIVRPVRGPHGGGVRRFELVAGERRWRAAERAGLARIPAVVRDLSDEESAEWALVENMQREDLNPVDRAMALRAMCERFGLSHGQVADRIGVERPTVANLVRLTELEPGVLDLLASGRLGVGHGKALLGAPPGQPRLELAARAARESWSVRRTEREAARRAAPAPAPPRPGPPRPTHQSLEQQLGEHLGTKVRIATDASGARGRLTIEFYGLEHFDGLMARLGFQMQ